jgi:hypothetical protein
VLPSRWQRLLLLCPRRRRNRAVPGRSPTSDLFRDLIQPTGALSCRQLNCDCPAGQARAVLCNPNYAIKSVPRQHDVRLFSCLNHPVRNMPTYFGKRRLRSSTVEDGGNGSSDFLLVPGGTGYQPVVVGNLPTTLLFVAISFSTPIPFCQNEPKKPLILLGIAKKTNPKRTHFRAPFLPKLLKKVKIYAFFRVAMVPITARNDKIQPKCLPLLHQRWKRVGERRSSCSPLSVSPPAQSRGERVFCGSHDGSGSPSQ